MGGLSVGVTMASTLDGCVDRVRPGYTKDARWWSLQRGRGPWAQWRYRLVVWGVGCCLGGGRSGRVCPICVPSAPCQITSGPASLWPCQSRSSHGGSAQAGPGQGDHRAELARENCSVPMLRPSCISLCMFLSSEALGLSSH